MRPGWRRPALIGLAVVAVALAATLANLALLDAAGEDRLGTLRPVDPSLVAGGRGATTGAAAPRPAATTREAAPRPPATTARTTATPPPPAPTRVATDDDGPDEPAEEVEEPEDDDGQGRGRGRGRGGDDD